MGDGKNKTVARQVFPAVKEKVFSILAKMSEEGITDGRRVLWTDFAPHVAVVKKEDGYTVWLWRDCVVIRIYLDNDFNVVGFDIERP